MVTQRMYDNLAGFREILRRSILHRLPVELCPNQGIDNAFDLENKILTLLWLPVRAEFG